MDPTPMTDRELLLHLILNPPARRDHFARPRLVPKAPWTIDDPLGVGGQPVLDDKVIRAAYGGPSAWTDEEVSFLLAVQSALTNFALLIHDLMPDWWIQALGGAEPD